MNIDRRPFYKKELTFKIARSYGPGRYDSSYEEVGVDYPIGYVRFTEGRNVEEFLRLLSEERLCLTDLITHVISFEDAAKAYEMITTNKAQEKYIGILLEYSEDIHKWDSVIINTHRSKIDIKKGKIGLGLIGAGNFARATMLPIMKKTGLYEFVGLATTGGIGSAQANEMQGFQYTTNDYRKLLEDASIDLIAISTQHNSHAKFIIEALMAGKSVYCEKPLCLTLEELDLIEKTYHESSGELFCGLNRRHAPLIKEIKKQLHTDKIPAIYDYIANAGYIPPEHWVQDEKAGGGRIIGEACHFIDTIQSLDGSELIDLQVNYAKNEAYPMKDNAIISLQFASGAVGTIIYTSMGSKKYPKEQLRVFSNGSVCMLDNYVKLTRYGASKHMEIKMRQDKGIENEYKFIYEVIQKSLVNNNILDVIISHGLLIKDILK